MLTLGLGKKEQSKQALLPRVLPAQLQLGS